MAPRGFEPPTPGLRVQYSDRAELRGHKIWSLWLFKNVFDTVEIANGNLFKRFFADFVMILRKKVIEGIIKKLQNSHSMSKKDLKKLLEELHVRVSTLHNIATHDDKTGLHNTSFMREIFTLEAAQAERGKPLSAIIIDVDFFKKVNDTYGQLLADILLKKICIVLVRELRPYDILARFGGDEFLVLLPDTRLDVAASVAERVR